MPESRDEYMQEEPVNIYKENKLEEILSLQPCKGVLIFCAKKINTIRETSKKPLSKDD